MADIMVMFDEEEWELLKDVLSQSESPFIVELYKRVFEREEGVMFLVEGEEDSATD